MADVKITGESGTIYTLNFGTNAACALEESDGRTYPEITRELRGHNPRVSVIRKFVQTALLDPANATPEQCGALIDDVGGWAVVLAALEGESDEALLARHAIKQVVAEQTAGASTATVTVGATGAATDPVTH